MDEMIVHLFNGIASRSWAFDALVSMMVNENLIKGGVMLSMVMYAWFSSNDAKTMAENRKKIIVSLMGVIVALTVARLLVQMLSFRPRPLNNAELHFVLPFGVNPGALSKESSFPSDHASLFFALATGVFLVSRKVGSLAYAFAIFVVSLPRIYLGLHYPSDLIVGAVLGTGVVAMTNLMLFRGKLVNWVFDWSEKHRPLFFAMFFLLSFEIASIFDATRYVLYYLSVVFGHKPGL